ncbi:MAG: glycoside hydrolase family 1 protein [Candidatus Kerfeldbacteria bacterium]|nr:glycoside hydrolase family 1 protein [Candidatus Kerfeldbacteria bacterium]
MQRVLRFPEGFLWGAATSAHQVEGDQDNDWTAWEKLGRIKDGSVSGAACEHWTRYQADFDLAKELHHTAHRFSVEWSRIEPREGEWNEAALAHYRDVVRALRQRQIEPFVTLWHFTNPRWLAERGGWEHPDTPRLFARYVGRVVEALPDVRFWITVNEPNVYALLSYFVGEWPPEVRSWRRALNVLHRLAAAHAQAWRAIKAAQPDAQVGSALNLVDYRSERPHNVLDRVSTLISDRIYNHRWLRMTASYEDFIGVNHYLQQRIRFGSVRRPIIAAPQEQPLTDFGWKMNPPSMYRVLRLAGSYGKSLYVTENGLADAHDRWRQRFIRDYLGYVHRALQDGVDIRGYFHWSLLDNFEWREGFSKRFGLVAVDFTTQRRSIRPSARWFAEVCRKNALVLPDA